MEVEAVRQAGNLQTLFKDFRRDLENHSTRSAGKTTSLFL